jgi:integrase
MDPDPVDRVATPAEFAALLAALEPVDALAYAFAGYGCARAAQIQRVRWEDVDLTVGAVEWGVELDARKYEASRRVVPAVPPLLALLKRVYLLQGRPDARVARHSAALQGKLWVNVDEWTREAREEALGGRRPKADHVAGGSAYGCDVA